MVKGINKEHFRYKYGSLNLDGLRIIGIDEFPIRIWHVYMTVVVGLETGRVVYVGGGKGKDYLDGFWRRLTRSKNKIEAVSTDLSGAFISAVRKYLSEAVLLFDHFHVVKLANDALGRVRIDTYKNLDTKEKPNATKDLKCSCTGGWVIRF